MSGFKQAKLAMRYLAYRKLAAYKPSLLQAPPALSVIGPCMCKRKNTYGYPPLWIYSSFRKVFFFGYKPPRI